jgi:transcriptional antiterminator
MSPKTGKDLVLEYLESQKGKSLTVRTIAQALGLSERVVRRVIRELRQEIPGSLKITTRGRMQIITYLGLEAKAPEKEEAPREEPEKKRAEKRVSEEELRAKRLLAILEGEEEELFQA